MVEQAACELFVQLARIDADEVRPYAGGDHLPGQLVGGDEPAGKDRLQACASHLLDAVGAHIFQEEVTVGDAIEALSDCLSADFGHEGLVDLIGAGPGERDLPERQACGGSLEVKQFLAEAVHGHAAEVLIDGGEQAHNFELRVLAEQVQSPSAVFATGPAQQDAFLVGCGGHVPYSRPEAEAPLKEGRGCAPGVELLLTEVGAVAALYHAGIPGQIELGYVVLVEGADQLRVGAGDGCLRVNHGQVVIDTGGKPLLLV